MYIENNPQKKYLEQWNRVQRYHEKVKSFSRGGSKQNDEEMLDVIISFFLHAYHLKDWVKSSTEDLDEELKHLFSKANSNAMFICRNLAQGIKHLSLDDPELDEKTTIAHQNVTVYVGTGMSRYSWDVSLDGKKIDVCCLANECLGEWTEFLRKYNLI